MRQDIAYALRTFAHARTFTNVVILTLALGIGAATAMFSVVNAVLLNPLPFPNSDRLVVIWEKFVREPDRVWTENSTLPFRGPFPGAQDAPEPTNTSWSALAKVRANRPVHFGSSRRIRRARLLCI